MTSYKALDCHTKAGCGAEIPLLSLHRIFLGLKSIAIQLKSHFHWRNLYYSELLLLSLQSLYQHTYSSEQGEFVAEI